MKIVFSDENNKLTPEMKALMEQAAVEALSMEFGEEIGAAGFAVKDTAAELGVTVVSDEEIRELNRDYRGIDKVTDVLSFPQFEGHSELLEELLETLKDKNEEASLDTDIEPDDSDDNDELDVYTTLIGDVVICCDQAARQAEEYGTGITREMLYLFVHSVMHLFGYDHMEEAEKKEMRAAEERVLDSMGISRR